MEKQDARTIQAQLEEAGINPRARNAAVDLFQKWTPEEVVILLAQLAPVVRRSGSSEICGPDFYRYRGIPVWVFVGFWSVGIVVAAALLPL